MDQHVEKGLEWILMVSVSPIALLVLILMALLSLLDFLCKASLLFIIVAINTPFAVMYHVSVLVFKFYVARLRGPKAGVRWNYSDPRAKVSVEIQIIVSDFFKVVAGELLLVMSAGIITYYTTPLLVFYISTGIWVTAIFHKWLNTDCLSKTALSCLCDAYGLSPLMFLFSFLGFFDIGGHPVAKCSFVATKAFLFIKDGLNTKLEDSEEGPKEVNTNQGHIKFRDDQYRFNGAEIKEKPAVVEFVKWDPFETGLFQLIPRIEIKKRDFGKYLVKSFMVLKLRDVNICEYPVERLELSEDYSKVNELYHFLAILARNDGFVTDKMRGRYEHSLTLLEIVDGVQASVGYRIVDPMDAKFVVAGSTKDKNG